MANNRTHLTFDNFPRAIRGIRKKCQTKLFRKAAKIEREGKGKDKWTKDDYLLYYAYIVYRLNDWKYEAAAQLSKDGHRDLALKHPCNIDGYGAIGDAIKMVKPELADLPFENKIKAVESYLFDRKGNES